MKSLFLSLLILPAILLGQTGKTTSDISPAAKSIHPIAATGDNKTGATRAVVVGISDYQSPQIPDLQFAHRDAIAFADWLKSPAGGNVSEDNIQLRITDQATSASVSMALYGLVGVTKTNDVVIIYFSGHGDVESVLRGQPGFLLTYDTPPIVYMAGALNLRDLQLIVSALAEKQVKTIIITDACHSGNLAGNLNNGTQATAMSLSQRYANEVKIMSCQPNEYSIEGPQWGEGRGVFSYYLLKGLTGLADKNGDGAVNLFEAGRYLQDIVPAETSPQPQMPFTVGDLQTTIAYVDAPSFSLLQEKEAKSKQTLDKINIKGLEDEVLAKADSITRQQYAEFKNALATHTLIAATGDPEQRNEQYAWDLYLVLSVNVQLEPLLWMMQRNLAVALLDEVQQALNALLDNDPYEADHWKYNPAKYRDYPEYLQKAMILLGENHLFYRSVKAKKLFFEGYNLSNSISIREKQPAVLKSTAKAKYLESLAIEPEAAYPCYAVGSLYKDNATMQTDSVLIWMQKAVDRSPSWLLPYLDAAEELNNVAYDLPRAEHWLMKAKTYHPESYLLLIRLAWLNQWKNDPEAANSICRTLIALRPDLSEAWATLAVTQYRMQNDWLEAAESAEEALKRSPNNWYGRGIYIAALVQTNPDSAVHYCLNLWRKDSLDIGSAWAMVEMTEALIKLERFQEAEQWIDRLREGGDIVFQNALHGTHGRLRLQQGRLTEAEAEFKKTLVTNIRESYFSKILALLGEVKARQHKFYEAEALFKKAVDFPFVWDQNYNKIEVHFLYGRFLTHQNRPAEAQIQFDNALKISPKTWHYPMGMALLAAKKGRKSEALDWLEKSLSSYYFDEKAISEEPLFSKIRKTKRFKALMLNYFPKNQSPQK
ncbi:MAG: caspase family protein [Saprospiraceae bacterium]|nr:caspase family protein [Saprospiraceae bacterium]